MNENPIEPLTKEKMLEDLDSMIQDAYEFAKQGNQELIERIMTAARPINNFIKTSTGEDISKYLNANFAHILSDLAFNKVQYEDEDKVRYTQVKGNVFVDNEGIVSALNNEHFRPLILAPVRKLPREAFKETINVIVSTEIEETQNGKVNIYILNKNGTMPSKDGIPKKLIATYDPKIEDETKRSVYEPTKENEVKYTITKVNNSLVATIDIPAARIGAHETLIGANGVAYKERKIYDSYHQAYIDGELFVEHELPGVPFDDIFKGYVNPLNGSTTLPFEKIANEYRIANKGYDEAMLDYAIHLAKESDMTSEYLKKEFIPAIEKRKTEAKAWHSIIII